MPPAIESGHRTIKYYVGRDFIEGRLPHNTQEYDKVQMRYEEEAVTMLKGKFDEVIQKYEHWKEIGQY